MWTKLLPVRPENTNIYKQLKYTPHVFRVPCVTLQQHGNFFDYKSRLWLWSGFMAFCSAVSTESDVVLFWKQSNICWYVPLLVETCDSEHQLWDNGEERRAGAEVWKSTTLACTLLLIKVAEKYTGKKKSFTTWRNWCSDWYVSTGKRLLNPKVS